MADNAPKVSTPRPVLKARFLAGETFADFLTRPKKNSELWDALYKRASVAEPILARARIVKHAWHLLVLSEDWCGDSINTLPVVARNGSWDISRFPRRSSIVKCADGTPGITARRL